MGFIDTSGVPELPVFFNLVHAVGENCPNHKDDVKLVQYLLMSFYAPFPAWYRPKGDIGVTGFCGGATLNWIRKFQKDANTDKPNTVMVDGRVDRVRNKTMVGSISKTVYSLWALNYYTFAYNPTAYVATPNLIPLTNPMNVPPPSPDVVQEIRVPSSGGI